MFYLKKYRYIILAVLGIILILIAIFSKNNDKVEDDLILEPIEQEFVEIKDDELSDKKIKIDIKGAVKNPGVYELENNSRVNDAIEISGGLTKDADTSVINLSKNLTDEMVIIIYTKDEISEMLKGDTSIKYIEKECICPKLENDACIDNIVDNKPNNDSSNSSSSNNSKVSLNNATIDELMQLPGIGEVKAKAIINYREENGGFKTIEELKEVNGIGEATFNKIKDQLTL